MKRIALFAAVLMLACGGGGGSTASSGGKPPPPPPPSDPVEGAWTYWIYWYEPFNPVASWVCAGTMKITLGRAGTFRDEECSTLARVAGTVKARTLEDGAYELRFEPYEPDNDWWHDGNGTATVTFIDADYLQGPFDYETGAEIHAMRKAQ